MKVFKLFLLILVFFYSCSTPSYYDLYSYFSPKSKMSKIRVNESNGKPARFTFKLLEDSSIHEISEYKGTIVFLNFWATWCGSCIEELQELNKLNKHYKSKVIVLAISDEDTLKIKSFLKHRNIDFPNGYIDANDKIDEPFRHLRRGRPLSFLIDKNGIIKKAYPYPIHFNDIAKDIEDIL